MITTTKPVLEGDRVLLRPLTAADAPAMYESLDEPEAMRLTGSQATFTLEEVRAHCARIEHAAERADYGIIVEDRLIGEAVLNGIDRENRLCNFRIAIWYPADRDGGYGSEATELLVRHGFETLGLNRIELEVYAFNPRARRVYEKAGFVFEGTRRQALFWDDAPVDAHIMAMLRSDYDLRTKADR